MKPSIVWFAVALLAVLAAGFLGGRLIAARKALELQKDVNRMELAQAEGLAAMRVQAAEEKVRDMRAAGAELLADLEAAQAKLEGAVDSKGGLEAVQADLTTTKAKVEEQRNAIAELESALSKASRETLEERDRRQAAEKQIAEIREALDAANVKCEEVRRQVADARQALEKALQDKSK